MKQYVVQKSHANDILELERQCYPHEHLTLKQIEKIIDRLSSDGYILINNDKVIAYTLYDSNDDHIEVVRLGVHPFHRRCGHGTNLLTKVKSKLTANRPKLIVHVPEYLLNGQLFLRDQGLIASKVEYRHYRKHMTNSYMFVFLNDWNISYGADEESEIVASTGV
jgi:ribosomal protein S18 acetylase RimI-like enzyme